MTRASKKYSLPISSELVLKTLEFRVLTMGKSYLPLRAQTSSDFPEDSLLQLSDDSRSWLLTCKNFIIIFLFITNTVTFIYRAPTPNAKEQIPEDYG